MTEKIGRNSQKLRHDLAFELEERSLPEENGALVIVTGIKSEPALIEAEVWRGLSNLVQAEGWKEPYKKSSSLEADEETTIQTKPEINTLIFLIVFISILVVTISIMPLLFFPLKPKL